MLRNAVFPAQTCKRATAPHATLVTIDPNAQGISMSADQNKAIVLRWVEEAFNGGSVAVLGELFAEDVILHTSLRLGRGTFAPDRVAFPDLYKTVDVIIAEGDLVALRGTNRGTHLGTFVLPKYGALPPTGRQVRWTHVNIFRVIGGTIVEIWEHVNWLQLLEELGAQVHVGVVPVSPTPAVPPHRRRRTGGIIRLLRLALPRDRPPQTPP